MIFKVLIKGRRIKRNKVMNSNRFLFRIFTIWICKEVKLILNLKIIKRVKIYSNKCNLDNLSKDQILIKLKHVIILI
jgi:hypothetical protein